MENSRLSSYIQHQLILTQTQDEELNNSIYELFISLGIKTINDITPDSLIRALDTICTQNNNVIVQLKRVHKIYKNIIDNNKDIKSLFDNSTLINLKLFYNSYFIKRYSKGFRPYSLTNPINISGNRIFWLLDGWDKYYKKFEIHDYLSIDYSLLPLRWQKIFIRYTLTVESKACILELNSLIGLFSKLITYKSKHNYANNCITVLDISYLKGLYKNSYHYDYYVKHFLEWLHSIDERKVDMDAINELTYHKTGYTKLPKGISDEDFKALFNEYLKKTDDYGIQQITVLLLLRTTNIRLSAILALREENIKESQKINQYIIETTTKTSNGEIVRYGISKQTYDLLIRSRNISLAYEESLTYRSLKGKIFLINKKGVKQLYPAAVENYMKQMSISAGLNTVYSPCNIRKAYMTDVVDYSIENNLGDIVEQMMTGHKNENITYKNYFDYDISRVVECTYGITIGDPEIINRINADRHIKDIEFSDSRVVGINNTIGYCSTTSCRSNGLIPCWLCESFYTTTDFLPVFKAELDRLKNLIMNCNQEHDIENYQTQIKVIGIYIASLLQRIKENNK